MLYLFRLACKLLLLVPSSIQAVRITIQPSDPTKPQIECKKILANECCPPDNEPALLGPAFAKFYDLLGDEEILGWYPKPAPAPPVSNCYDIDNPDVTQHVPEGVTFWGLGGVTSVMWRPANLDDMDVEEL